MKEILDKKDKQILDILSKQSNLPTRAIAKKALLPATTVHHRIKRLHKQGVIQRFTIELDPKKVDRGFMAYILISANLVLLKEKHKTQYDLVDEIKKFYFVERVDIVSGGTDLVAVVRVKDVEEFDRILLGKLQSIEGIDKTQSLIVIHEG